MGLRTLKRALGEAVPKLAKTRLAGCAQRSMITTFWISSVCCGFQNEHVVDLSCESATATSILQELRWFILLNW